MIPDGNSGVDQSIGHHARLTEFGTGARGECTGARGRRQRRGVQSGVTQAVLCQPVDIGRIDQPTESRHLTVTHVVEDENDDAGRAFLGPLRLRQGGFRFGHRAADNAGERGSGFVCFYGQGFSSLYGCIQSWRAAWLHIANDG